MEEIETKTVHERSWSAFEERHLKRELFNGDEINDIAARHKRTSLSVRAKVIDLGLFDPALDQYQAFGTRNEPLVRERDLGLGSIGFEAYTRQFLAWSRDEIYFFNASYREGFSIAELALIFQRHPIDILGALIFPRSPYVSENAEPAPFSAEEKALRFERGEEFFCFLVDSEIDLTWSADAVSSQASCYHYHDPHFDDEDQCEDREVYAEPPPNYFLKESDDYDATDWEDRLGGPDDSYWEEKNEGSFIESVDEAVGIYVSPEPIEGEKDNGDCEDQEYYQQLKDKEEPKYRNLVVSLFSSRFENTKLAIIERVVDKGAFMPVEVIGPAGMTVDEEDKVVGPHGALAKKLEQRALTYSDPDSISRAD